MNNKKVPSSTRAHDRQTRRFDLTNRSTANSSAEKSEGVRGAAKVKGLRYRPPPHLHLSHTHALTLAHVSWAPYPWGQLVKLLTRAGASYLSPVESRETVRMSDGILRGKRIWVADHFETPAPRPGGLLQVEEDNRGQGGVRQALLAACRCVVPACGDPIGRRGRRLHDHHIAALPTSNSDAGQVVESNEISRQRGTALRVPGVRDPGEMSPILSHRSPTRRSLTDD